MGGYVIYWFRSSDCFPLSPSACVFCLCLSVQAPALPIKTFPLVM